MEKKMIGLIIGTAMLAATTAAVAATSTCTVVSINDKEVVLECTDTEKLKVDDKIKIKPLKKKTQIEGC